MQRGARSPRRSTHSRRGAWCSTPTRRRRTSSYSLASLHTGSTCTRRSLLGQRQPLPTLARALAAAGRRTAALYTQASSSPRPSGHGLPRRGLRLRPRRPRRPRRRRAGGRGDGRSRRPARRGEPGFLLSISSTRTRPTRAAGRRRPRSTTTRCRASTRRSGGCSTTPAPPLARDLVVAVTADHGEGVRRARRSYHGSALYDEQVRVPLVVAAPNLAPGRCSRPSSSSTSRPRSRASRGRAPLDARPRPAPVDARAADARRRHAAGVRRGQHPQDGAPRQWKLIADLTYGVDELYDLTADPPNERRNPRPPGPTAAPPSTPTRRLARVLADRGGRSRRPRPRRRPLRRPELASSLTTRAPVAARVEAVELLEGFGDAALSPAPGPARRPRVGRPAPPPPSRSAAGERAPSRCSATSP